jgi:biotin transport system ATP-binding protein
MALSDVTLQVQRGSCTLLAGSCGSGKSVLLRILAGLESPSKGSFFIDTPKELRTPVGLMMQDVSMQLLGQSVWDDIRLAGMMQGLSGTEVDAKAEAAMQTLAMEHLRGQDPQDLSGGQMRQVLLAGVLTQSAPIILLDEPFANLDYPSVCLVRQALMALLQQGKTLIIATHEIEKIISIAEHIIILEQGRVALSQTIAHQDSIEWAKYRLKDPHLPAWQW